jgi:hypothetical protein
MKIGKMKCPELPHPRHTPGKLEVFGRPCPEIPQHEPHNENDIQAHKQMASGIKGHPQ